MWDHNPRDATLLTFFLFTTYISKSFLNQYFKRIILQLKQCLRYLAQSDHTILFDAQSTLPQEDSASLSQHDTSSPCVLQQVCYSRLVKAQQYSSYRLEEKEARVSLCHYLTYPSRTEYLAKGLKTKLLLKIINKQLFQGDH